MFTGLIVELGEVISLQKRGGSATLSLRCSKILQDTSVGDSISVNGACLTVTKISGDTIHFDISQETLKSTNLSELKISDKVNLEPSLKPISKLGGHFVTGHVDCIGRIRSKKIMGDFIKFEIEASADILRYIVPKGSIAVDGISLTVVDVFQSSFTFVIIPHTASMTTMGFKNPGDTVNLEADILAKYTAKFLNIDKDTTLLSALKRSGVL